MARPRRSQPYLPEPIEAGPKPDPQVSAASNEDDRHVDRQHVQALVDYFLILQEWSRKSPRDDLDDFTRPSGETEAIETASLTLSANDDRRTAVWNPGQITAIISS